MPRNHNCRLARCREYSRCKNPLGMKKSQRKPRREHYFSPLKKAEIYNLSVWTLKSSSAVKHSWPRDVLCAFTSLPVSRGEKRRSFHRMSIRAHLCARVVRFSPGNLQIVAFECLHFSSAHYPASAECCLLREHMREASLSHEGVIIAM